MFRSIVVGTDGSPNAERAIRTAGALASLEPGAEVHVVTAYHPLSAKELAELGASLPDEFKPVIHPHVVPEDRLTSARTILEKLGLDPKTHEIDDDPTDAILSVADDVGADLIVVGSRGESVAKRMIHGSVSTKVMHHAPCSVLVVQPGSN